MLLNKEELELERQKLRRRIMDKCPKCHGKGFIVKTDEHGDGTSFPCSCKKDIEACVRLVDYGVPLKFLNPKWNMTMLEDKPYYNDIKDYVDNFIDYYDEGKGLFLFGPQGRGKTTIECIIAKEIASKINPDTGDRRNCFVVGFMMFEDIIKKQFDKEDKNILNSLLYKTDLLIIDNLGNESGRNENQFAQRTLEMILRKRDNASLPTIVSTNYNLDEVGSEYNKDIKDFLTQNNICVYFSGDNYRVKKETKALTNEDDFEF